jgi:hypothetical protein
MLGLEDKKQIIMAISSSVIRDLLPPYFMFIGNTFQSFAPNNQGKINCIKDGWDLTFSENHWSSLETTKKFVTNIFFLYLQS